MSDAPSSSDPFGIGVLSGGQVAGIVQPASSAGVTPQAASSDSSSPLGALSSDLADIVNTLKQGNAVKAQTGDALSQAEQLLGINPSPTPPPTDQSQSILTIVAVIALLVLGGAVVWKLAHEGG